MEFETLYAYILVVAGILSLANAVQGKSIEASENPRLSQNASRIIYALTGALLLLFGFLRLK